MITYNRLIRTSHKCRVIIEVLDEGVPTIVCINGKGIALNGDPVPVTSLQAGDELQLSGGPTAKTISAMRGGAVVKADIPHTVRQMPPMTGASPSS